jgi:nucleoside-diphosphate-sugar epimerase
MTKIIHTIKKMNKIIVVAGATGNLGERIVKTLLAEGAEVRALVRPSSNSEKIKHLEQLGAKVFKVEATNAQDIAKACQGANCVVSALSGLREVIIDAQKALLDGAILAGIPRFIPSDFSLDFTKTTNRTNRNLDLRREFHQYLDKKTEIAATSIFNGAFADMLTGQMPMILFKQKRIFYWGNGDQKLDFTTIQNVADYTAHVALETTTPRFLRIAGDEISAKGLQQMMSELSGEHYKTLRPGGLGLFGVMIKMTRFFAPNEQELYPAWQGMQYLHNMLEGRCKIEKVDNQRHPNVRWTTAKDVISAHLATE